MQVILLRHGATAGNALRRYIGRTDQPLSPEGEAGARLAGCDPARKQVYVTPLLRTQQTARILFPNAEQTILPELREMDFGAFEDRSADDLADDADYRAWVEGGCLGVCPGGESVAGFSQRVCRCFEEVLEALRGSDPCPAFVLHGGVIMALMDRFARPHLAFYDAWVSNCQGFRCTVSPAGALVLTDWVRLEKLE